MLYIPVAAGGRSIDRNFGRSPHSRLSPQPPHIWISPYHLLHHGWIDRDRRLCPRQRQRRGAPGLPPSVAAHYRRCCRLNLAAGGHHNIHCLADVAPAPCCCSNCVCYSIPPPSKHRPSRFNIDDAGHRRLKFTMCATPSIPSPPFAGSSKKKCRFQQKTQPSQQKPPSVQRKTIIPASHHPHLLVPPK